MRERELTRNAVLRVPVWVLLAAGLLFAVVVSVLASPAWAATIDVNSMDDQVDATPGDGVCETAIGNGVCTLRAAVMEANANGEDDTINVPAGTYTLTLTGTEGELFGENDAVGDLDITGNDPEDLDQEDVNVTIVGAGARTTTVTGGEGFDDRIFDIPSPVFTTDPNEEPVPSDAVVNISGLTITGGNVDSIGGGIRNIGTLTLTRSTLTENTAALGGGGIRNDLDLTVDRSTISDNVVESSEGEGGGLGGGAGIFNNDAATLVNSTISGNEAGTFGGGVNNFGGDVTSTNVTFNGNLAPTGANFANSNLGSEPGSSTGTSSFLNTIISNPEGGGENCSGSPNTSLGNNLDSDGSCEFGEDSDINNQNPRLEALANNGGPTDTHALRRGSPAIDEAETGAPATDQRGVSRPQNGDNTGAAVDDIGAFELEEDDGVDNPPPNNPNRCTIIGTDGDDALRGTNGRDVICGLGGDDDIRGLDGGDIIRGGAGNDNIRGDAGNDELFGEAGNDNLYGDAGKDRLVGGPGKDKVKQ